MNTMDISLPDSLKAFIDEQEISHGFETNSEYVRALICKEQNRLQLRESLLAGARSNPSALADSAYFTALRERVKTRAKG